MMFRQWGSGNESGAIYEYLESESRHRIGHCDFIPRDGDYCVCIEHSGDCFDDYIAIRNTGKGTFKKIGEFGAYRFGEKLASLGKKDFHLLQAGEEVMLSPYSFLLENEND